MSVPNDVIFISSCDGFTGACIANHLGANAAKYSDIQAIYLGCQDTSEAHELLDQQHIASSKVRLFDINPTDKSRIDECLKNVTTLCLVPPTRADKLAVTTAFIDAAERAGVCRCLLVSWAGCDLPGAATQMRNFMRTEEHLNASRIPVKMIARPTFYVQNLFLYAHQIIHLGILPAPTGNGKWSSVDLDQFGAAVARMLTCPKTMEKAAGQVMTFTSAESLDGPTMARQLSESLDRPVEFHDISRSEAEKLIRTASTELDDSEVNALLETYDLIQSGRMDFTTNDAQKILGDDFVPLRFKKVIERDMDQLKALASGTV